MELEEGRRICQMCHNDFALKDFSSSRARYCRTCQRVRKYSDRADTSYASLQHHCDICNTWCQVLHVDHDHQAIGEIRGMLCPSCNKALGHLKDDPARAIRIAEYLITRRNFGTLHEEAKADNAWEHPDECGYLLSSFLAYIVKRYGQICEQVRMPPPPPETKIVWVHADGTQEEA